MNNFKPWTPYRKALKRALSLLLVVNQPSPFHSPQAIGKFISNLKFAESSIGDMECRSFAECLIANNWEHPDLCLAGRNQNLSWQLILRCNCALDLCMGKLYNRKEFDWSRTPDAVYRDLLIDFWRENALYWHAKIIAPGTVRFELFKSDLLARLSKTNPSHN